MKKRPILFSAPMVRALLAGTKTQTRRVCKSQPYANGFKFDGHDILCHNDYLPPSAMLMDVKRGPHRYSTSNVEGWEVECPYGLLGERLWVREAWRSTGDGGRCNSMPPRDMQAHDVWYEADGVPPTDECAGKLRPSMFMPRWASRLTLEITEVRVERLQDISEDDAQAEGISQDTADAVLSMAEAMEQREPHPFASAYETLWDDINGPGAWDANPYVWAISFRRID